MSLQQQQQQQLQPLPSTTAANKMPFQPTAPRPSPLPILMPSQQAQTPSPLPMLMPPPPPAQPLQMMMPPPPPAQPLQMMMPPPPVQTQNPAPVPLPPPAPQAAAMPLPRLMRGGEKIMISLSDDNIMMKQIVETHLPDGREVDVKPLLRLVEDILNRATFTVNTVVATQVESLEDKTSQFGYATSLDSLSYVIDRISCELAVKALSGGDAHVTTLSIFHMLSSFSWDAKLVLTLAAFAFNYGEFWLLAQISSTNALAKSMAILKQLHMILEHSGPLKPRFDALNNLIQAMLEVTRCVVELKELPSAYISSEVPALSAAVALVPTTVYWTIRSAIACANQITSLTSLGHEYLISTTEVWELSTLVHKLKNISEHLQKQINLCYKHIEDRRYVEAYQNLLNLFETIHIDNMKILRALIYAKDDIQPLVDGSSKRRVALEILRRKNVLLLISGLDISSDELSILEQIHSESKLHTTRLDIHPYEVVWIPIVDRAIKWNDAMQRQFERVQSTMPWYSVYHPNLIENAVIRFARERLHFRNKPILMVLDPQGKVVCPNAIHMMWIWGSNAFPFTTLKEEALWKDETWRLELLIDGIDQNILNWVREEKYIFLYGGDDIEWIRRFTTAARQVAQAAKIPLEMIYVGKSNKREQVRRTITTITAEKLSSTWQDLTMIWFFWTRLESMLFSKIQLGKADDRDLVMQQIKKLLSYDKAGGWAVLSKGSNMVVNGHGTTVLPVLLEYDLWKEQVTLKGYDTAFKEHHDRIHDVAHPCCRFEFPSEVGRIPESMTCPECQRYMEKLITFLCCHEEGIPTVYD